MTTERTNFVYIVSAILPSLPSYAPSYLPGQMPNMLPTEKFDATMLLPSTGSKTTV